MPAKAKRVQLGKKRVVLSLQEYLRLSNRLKRLAARARKKPLFKTDEAVIESAVALTANQRKKLEKMLAEKLGKKMKVSFKVNPQLLGGLKITVGSLVIDRSLRGKLLALKENLESYVEV